MKKKDLRKSLLCVLLVSALAGAQATAATLETPEIDVEKVTVTISGKADNPQKAMNLIVLNPNAQLDSLGKDGLQYQRVIYSDENGEYSHTFTMNLDDVDDTGVYTVYIGGAGMNKVEKQEFYFASSNDRKKLVDIVMDEEDSKELGKLLADEENIKTLSLTSFEPFMKQDKEEIAKAFLAVTKNWEEEEKENCTPAKMQKTIYEASVVAAFNNGKSDLVIDGNGEFLYDDILSLSKIDKKYGVTLYEAYNTLLSEKGQSAVRKALFNNDYKNVQDIEKDFMVQVVLKGITNPEKNGFAHIDKILTDSNAKAVGLEINKTLTDDNKIELKESNDFDSIDDLQEAIDSLKKGSSGSSGSSGGNKKPSSNTGSFTVDKIPESTTDKETNKEENKEENKKEEYFDDLTNYEWAREAINSLYEKGIINGVADKCFAPDRFLTREQAVKIICTAKGIAPIEEESGFSDVESGAWYAGYVAAAKAQGLVNGVSDTEFGIGREITRQEFAVIIKRAFDISSSSEELDFEDSEEIAQWAKDAVAALSAGKIINGYSDNTFRPLGSCTRAEMAVVIYRVLGGNA